MLLWLYSFCKRVKKKLVRGSITSFLLLPLVSISANSSCVIASKTPIDKPDYVFPENFEAPKIVEKPGLLTNSFEFAVVEPSGFLPILLE